MATTKALQHFLGKIIVGLLLRLAFGDCLDALPDNASLMQTSSPTTFFSINPTVLNNANNETIRLASLCH
jgi:hypothetical protein